MAERGLWQDGSGSTSSRTSAPTFNGGDIGRWLPRELAKRRYLELLGRGAETVLEAASGWLEYSEKMLRQEIARLPDGRYETDVGWLDDDGRNRGQPLPIKVAVEIQGDEITFDLTGLGRGADGLQLAVRGTTVSA